MSNAPRAPAQSSYLVQTIQGEATIVTPSATALRPLHFSPSSDPAQLSRDLFNLQTRLNDVVRVLRTNPLAISASVLGLAVTSGASFPVYHRLGRVPIGWVPIDAQTAAWSGYRVPPATGALGPDGQPQEATYLTLMPGSTGTYSFLVF